MKTVTRIQVLTHLGAITSYCNIMLPNRFIKMIQNSLHRDLGHSDPSTHPSSHKVLHRSSQREPGRVEDFSVNN